MLDQRDTRCQVGRADFVSPTWHYVGMEAESAVRERIAGALAAWIKARKTTKSGLSDDTGIGRQTIDDILEKRRLASSETLIKLATFFDTSPGALLDGHGPGISALVMQPVAAGEKELRSPDLQRLASSVRELASGSEAMAGALLLFLDHVELPQSVRGTIRELIVSRKSA